jgi:hypothetical protein
LKIVYHCYGGAHASPTAAAIHLGILPTNRRPTFAELLEVPRFDSIRGWEHGKLFLAGVDNTGNEVYTMGRRNSAKLVINIIKEFTSLCGGDPEEYYFVNCVQLLNPFMVTGGYSSRALGWVGFGRPIVTFGTILSFPVLVRIVQRTIREVQTIYIANKG